MKVSIICPLYNGEKYIKELYSNIYRQENIEIESLEFILTESSDLTESVLKEIGAKYNKISKQEFSHSLIREKAAFSSNGEIIVFITQDIKIIGKDWLANLISGIVNDECEASFSRQIGYENHGLEKYIREVNYPEVSRIVTKDDVEKLGIMSFFFSDTSSAIKKSVFESLNGYDNKDLPTNEDMYFAYKLIMNGYRIKYESESKVIHSHEFSLKQVYNRYKDIGKFFAQNPYFDKYKASKRGKGVLKYVIKRAIEDKKYSIIFDLFTNFTARVVGMKVGKRKK
ncbi:glycosyltransferase [Clostridium gasigenes]|uniref:glycosyltransferase n=1 Tax=Clostridium gasigenes TaxID=94869 RepID=UPI00143855E2|nr:glycosyltransferase [Clostridium gasigenes]NKF07424.1 glycosyltransferase [Clostridium gasigenes]QSW17866.1 glycosyltransferase [Clostridium gasigenes]